MAEKKKSLLTTDIKGLSSSKKKDKVEVSDERNTSLSSKQHIAIDIGSKNIKFVLGKEKRGNVIINKAFKVHIPENSISDGNLHKTLIIAEMIKNVLKIFNVRPSDANFTNNSTLIINREIIIPKTNKSDLDSMIRFQIGEYLPINLDEYIIQYKILEEIKEENSDKYRLLVITYPKKMAQEYFNLGLSCNLRPNGLDVNYNSLNRLIDESGYINEDRYEKEDTLTFLDMGAETITLTMFKGGKLTFTRILKYGGNTLDNRLAFNLNMPLEAAEKERMKNGSLKKEDEKSDFNIALEEIVYDWMDELQRLIQFYNNKYPASRVKKIYLYGGLSYLDSIDKFINAYTNIPVRHLSKIKGVIIKDSVDANEIKYYFNAIGAIKI